MAPHCGSDPNRQVTVLEASKSLSENNAECFGIILPLILPCPTDKPSLTQLAAHWDAHTAPGVPFPQLTSSWSTALCQPCLAGTDYGQPIPPSTELGFQFFPALQ